jgi:hypothetical protein
MTEREQFLSDILTTAVEGGIGYWAEVCDIVSDDVQNVLSFKVRDFEASPSEPWKEVTLQGIEEAITLVKEEKVKIGKFTRNDILFADCDQDAGMIDAEAADVLVQIAAFGEIIYS